MPTRNISVSVVMVSILVFVFACSTAKPQYMEARRIDTIAAYQGFLKNHPVSEYSNTAKTRIEEINFEMAKSVDTLSAYEQFIDASDSELFKNYANQLILKIYEDDYQKAKTVDTLEAYETYLEKYPNSIFIAECQMRIESLIWNRTIKENTAVSYYKYIYNCSSCGRHEQEARNRLNKAIKFGARIDVSTVKSSVEKILKRSDIVVVQRNPKGITTQTGSMGLQNLMDADDVLVSLAKEAQAISSIDLAKGNYESVKKLRLKHRVAGNSFNAVGFSTIIIYSEENGPTDVIFLVDGKGYFFQETGAGIY